MDSQTTDFSLDMISSDMDFETAYNIYSGLQQQIAKSEVEQLQKVQQLNQSYHLPFQTQKIPDQPDMSLPFDQDNESVHLNPILHSNGDSPIGLDSALSPSKTFLQNFNYTFSDSQQPDNHGLNKNIFEQHRLQIIQGLKPSNNTFLTQNIETKGVIHTHSDYANLLSANESNALEHFLDSIGQDQELGNLMDAKQVISQKNKLLNEFSYKDDYATSLPINNQQDDHSSYLPSPISSLDSNSNAKHKKRSITQEDDDSAMSTTESPSGSRIKRKRITRKPLLTDEQKKINHSTSEQKRRQLIKSAFDRITDLVCFSNEKTKNLSKFTALQKVSDQIRTLNEMNEKLRALSGL